MNSLDIHEVLKYLPHRYPFLLIDRVLDFTANQSLTALKNVTINEPFFPGHFPHRPVMPGVLILEAMAQACAILSLRSLNQIPSPDSVVYFVGIDDARFRRPVEPGDQLRLTATFTRKKRMMYMYECQAFVGDEEAASASLMCTYKGVGA
ncbi:MAG TPA: 3-hydroxyacyl-ACP dehydratase FabZ [Burkholderiaceae bacterium]|nr:3-hydroxyacyl-ACP dehydratase FabZ [Burkholderiaceae bacterium]